jgi:hypothetical protein
MAPCVAMSVQTPASQRRDFDWPPKSRLVRFEDKGFSFNPTYLITTLRVVERLKGGPEQSEG